MNAWTNASIIPCLCVNGGRLGGLESACVRFGICSNVGLPLAARHPEALETLEHGLEGGLERLKMKRLS